MVVSNKSKTLISYFIKNIKNNYVQKTKHTNFIFTELYEKILKSYIFVKQLKPDEFFDVSVRSIYNQSQIIKPRSFNLNSFPEDIRKHINENSKTEISYTFQLHKRKIKVVFTVEEVNINFKIYNKHIESILMWLHIINDYASEKCASSLVIYIYFTTIDKKIPKSTDYILNESNANTAFTMTCQVDSEIVVYRKEEWFKVFIHESFHCFGLDFSNYPQPLTTKYILNIFPVNSNVNLHESYSEFWAETMNVLFCSFFLLRNKNNLHEFIQNTDLLINLERSYSFFQLVKILNFMGLTYKDLYTKNKKSEGLRNALYKEQTNILSYYIIKTILMNDYQSFLLWCKNNNKSLFQFKNTHENQLEYCKYIETKYKIKSMTEGVENAEKLLNSKKFKSDKYLLNNMRMSICELG